ncbi:MAG: BMC domain-containing protein [Clostridiales bacterium]|nr:BMC domain-containing protein [Clostridiales bacterium]
MTNEHITQEELLDLIFTENGVPLDGQPLRLVRVRIPGREVDLAHIIGVSDESVYHNLGLHIGVHEGENHVGEAIGLMRFTPWEAVVIATDVAVKSAHVEVGFMDRFSGSLILTGRRTDVSTAVHAVHDYFQDTLGFPCCEVTEK